MQAWRLKCAHRASSHFQCFYFCCILSTWNHLCFLINILGRSKNGRQGCILSSAYLNNRTTNAANIFRRPKFIFLLINNLRGFCTSFCELVDVNIKSLEFVIILFVICLSYYPIFIIIIIVIIIVAVAFWLAYYRRW